MKVTNLNEISKEVYEANKLKGFDVKNENLGQTLCLIHSEISEALEALRKNKHADLNAYSECEHADDINEDDKEIFMLGAFHHNIKDTFEDEIADTFIRLMDLVGAFEIDIDKHIELKRQFNSRRQYKHGKAF